MTLLVSSRLITYLVVPVLAVFLGWLVLRLKFSRFLSPRPEYFPPPTWDRAWRSPKVLTKEELASFNGKNGARSFLTVLGEIYDVTGSNHYVESSGYYVFIGQDATLAFVNGKFDNSASDDVSKLNTDQIKGIEEWVQFYRKHETYKFVGVLEGRHYTKMGSRTKEWETVRDQMELSVKLAAEKAEESKKVPACNSKWTQNDGTTLWCNDSMVQFNLGSPLVPRKVDEGNGFTRCLCVEWSEARENPEKYKVYDGCDDGPNQSCHMKPVAATSR